MSGAKITEGEWHYCRANADTGGCPCGLIWAGDGETVVAIAQGPENAPHNDVTPTHETRVANARLIAAAPDLLKACGEAVNVLRVALTEASERGEMADVPVEDHVTIKLLTAVIRKARGE